MEKSIYETALEIAKNAARKTNCREFYFDDNEVAHYLEDKFHDDDLIDIYNRLEGGEFVLIKEICGEHLTSNICCNYLELYITIGEGTKQSTYLLYSQYNQEPRLC